MTMKRPDVQSRLGLRTATKRNQRLLERVDRKRIYLCFRHASIFPAASRNITQSDRLSPSCFFKTRRSVISEKYSPDFVVPSGSSALRDRNDAARGRTTRTFSASNGSILKRPPPRAWPSSSQLNLVSELLHEAAYGCGSQPRAKRRTCTVLGATRFA